MSTLHLVSQAQALEACLARVEEGDAILLLGAGAPACLELDLYPCKVTVMWHVLEDALEVHGINRDQPDTRIQVVNYAEFVEKAAAASRSVSWFN
jgi:sulfur relay protein TusB/DsrH